MIMLAAFFCPGIVLAWRQYSSLKKDGKSFQIRRNVVLRCLCRLNRAVEALQYFFGTTPNWNVAAIDRHIQMTLGTLPVLTLNLYGLLVSNSDVMNIRSLGMPAVILCSACLSARLDHFGEGPPANPQKYRFLDLKAVTLAHAVTIVLLDVTQIAYRICLFILVTAVSSLEDALLLFATAGLAFYLISWNNVMILSQGKFFASFSILFWHSFVIQIIHDMHWFEPVPPVASSVRLILPVRACQLLYGLCMLARSWDKKNDLNQDLFMTILIVGTISASLYFGLYTFYVFYVCREGRRRSQGQVEDFILTRLLSIQEKRNKLSIKSAVKTDSIKPICTMEALT